MAKRRSTVVERWWRGKSSSRGVYACDGKGVCGKVGGEETNLKCKVTNGEVKQSHNE